MKRDQVNLLRRFLKIILSQMYDFTFIHQKTVQTIFLASKGNQTRNQKIKITYTYKYQMY
jgi:hypothetical protein